MVNPIPPCSVCTRLNGRLLLNNAEVLKFVNSSDQLINHTCPQDYHCVGYEETGCCHHCSLAQSCAEGTISHATSFGTDNIVRIQESMSTDIHSNLSIFAKES